MEADQLPLQEYDLEQESQINPAKLCGPMFHVRHLAMEVQATYQSCDTYIVVGSFHTRSQH